MRRVFRVFRVLGVFRVLRVLGVFAFARHRRFSSVVDGASDGPSTLNSVRRARSRTARSQRSVSEIGDNWRSSGW